MDHFREKNVENEMAAIISFPEKRDNDILEVDEMTEEELDYELDSYGIDFEKSKGLLLSKIETEIFSIDTEENSKNSLLYFLEKIKNKITQERVFIKENYPKRREKNFDGILKKTQFYTASFFVCLTVITNYYSIEYLIEDTMAVFIITAFTLFQLLTILVHKHLQPKIENEEILTEIRVNRYITTYALYSSLNLLIIITEPTIKFSGPILTAITPIMIILIILMTIFSITIAISILCRSLDSNEKKEFDKKCYGKAGYYN